MKHFVDPHRFVHDVDTLRGGQLCRSGVEALFEVFLDVTAVFAVAEVPELERMTSALSSELEGVLEDCQNECGAANSWARIVRPPLKSAMYITHVYASIVCGLARIEVWTVFWWASITLDAFPHIVLLGRQDVRFANSFSRLLVRSKFGICTAWRIPTNSRSNSFSVLEETHPFSFEGRVDVAED
jgi:hypothetical protein